LNAASAMHDRVGERSVERLEPALHPSALGQVEEAFLRILDLLRCSIIEVVTVGVVDDILAEVMSWRRR